MPVISCFPAPWPLGDCPANFGNNDTFGATTAPKTSAVAGQGNHPAPQREQKQCRAGQAGITLEACAGRSA
jgi:hypothetical protein